ncbi:MAG: PhzF family phenazine biosynthesis protein, partial [Actinomycetota bacterium]
AGHPTLGAAWTLRRLGWLEGDEVVQNSAAGPTEVTVDGDELWFTRTGTSDPDLADRSPQVVDRLAPALGLERRALGLEARELGRPGRFEPAFADAGLRHLMVPVGTVDALGSISVDGAALPEVSPVGAFCFTATGAGHIRARAFFPNLGIPEDPATGSAVASLGAYLAARVGPVDVRIDQGVEMGRPSVLFLKATAEDVRVGGRCSPIFEADLEQLPPPRT